MTRHDRDPASIRRLRRSLLAWYDSHRRDLPWRDTRDPYAIWVSEIMLQQTRVAAVLESYARFMQRFPTLLALALAPEQDVLAQWSGLGYYRRARMLHKAAQFVAANLQGNFPDTSDALRDLPGIGNYTAAAIASIAHGEQIAVVDGNVERVLSRLQGWQSADTTVEAQVRRKVESLAADLLDPERPGDFNQAVMELGATICAPRSPMCVTCPLVLECRTQGEHKTPARPRMLSKEVGFALCVRQGPHAGVSSEVLLEQRPESSSVMPGMWELPALSNPDVPQQDLRMSVRHSIMQVNYYVRVRIVPDSDVDELTVAGGKRRWVPLVVASGMALTGLARKVLSRAHLLSERAESAVAVLTGADVP